MVREARHPRRRRLRPPVPGATANEPGRQTCPKTRRAESPRYNASRAITRPPSSAPAGLNPKDRWHKLEDAAAKGRWKTRLSSPAFTASLVLFSATGQSHETPALDRTPPA